MLRKESSTYRLDIEWLMLWFPGKNICYESFSIKIANACATNQNYKTIYVGTLHVAKIRHSKLESVRLQTMTVLWLNECYSTQKFQMTSNTDVKSFFSSSLCITESDPAPVKTLFGRTDTMQAKMCFVPEIITINTQSTTEWNRC